jgi:hypothetical protein
VTEERRKLARELLAKATPGPWYFDDDGCCYADEVGNDPVLEPFMGEAIRVEADDARLIAAAPELLNEALVEIARLGAMLGLIRAKAAESRERYVTDQWLESRGWRWP